MTFTCTLTPGQTCYIYNGKQVPCESYDTSLTTCQVSGREMLLATQGIGPSDSYWTYFGALCAIFVGFKILNLIAIYYPIESNINKIKTSISRFFEKKNDNLKESMQISVNPSFNRPNNSSEALKGDSDKTFSLSWSELSIILPKNGKVLVDKVSGFVTSGKILALMGPSGIASLYIYFDCITN
jgi:hypothetical protein